MLRFFIDNVYYTYIIFLVILRFFYSEQPTMASLKVIKTENSDFSRNWQQLRGKLSLAGELLKNPERLELVRRIVEKVRSDGDAAVARMTADYDKVQLTPGEFRIPHEQLQQAHKQFDSNLLKALREAIDNVRQYQQAIIAQPPADWTDNGPRLGVRYRPLQRVGICVPSASAPLVSTVIMTAVPALAAGVEQIAIISSPSYQNSIHPAILGLCWELKIQWRLDVMDVYRISGAQGVAALAFGTENIKKVDKIVGPSNMWGQLAKREVYGLVDIDSFAGPSEVLIIADNTANPQWVAADMLSQAEHAQDSCAILLSDSAQLVDDVAQQLDLQLAQLDRSEETAKCVEQFCLAVVVDDMHSAIDLANEFAPEHLQVQCKDSDDIADRITNAGAIFIGAYTPVATGDYYAGPSHTLPTGGSARFFSALNVNDFLKQSSIISYDQKALKSAAQAIQTIAQAEGLTAHANSVRIRR